MSKLIDADKLRAQIAERVPDDSYDDLYDGLRIAYNSVRKLIDEAPDLSLTWEDMRFITKTADEMLMESEFKLDSEGNILAEMKPAWMATEESYYKEVLKRFNEARK